MLVPRRAKLARDRRGTLACGSRFAPSLSREFEASRHEHPRPHRDETLSGQQSDGPFA